jgi:hypothetical protein
MSSKTIYHTHHIVPRHAGGTNDPSNLIRLTIEEHAEAHRKLYEEHGRIEDYYAWKGLCGQIGKDEILFALCRKGSQTKLKCKYCDRKISKHNMSRHLYSCSNGKEGTLANATRKGIKIKGWAGKNRTINDGAKNRKIPVDEILPNGWFEGGVRGVGKGVKKSGPPKKCITDGSATKRIPCDDPIPDGWKLGRHYNPKA